LGGGREGQSKSREKKRFSPESAQRRRAGGRSFSLQKKEGSASARIKKKQSKRGSEKEVLSGFFLPGEDGWLRIMLGDYVRMPKGEWGA